MFHLGGIGSQTFPRFVPREKKSTLSRKMGKQIQFLCILCPHAGTERGKGEKGEQGPENKSRL